MIRGQPAGEHSSFGDLLRGHREAAGLSQEALAERAGISPRGLLYLERGVRRPYPATLRRLADALSLTDQEREALTLAARQSTAAEAPATQDTAAPPANHRAALPAATAGKAVTTPSGPTHNLPAALSSFVGREHARARVQELLASHRLVTLVGAGGVGKTRLALAVAEAVLASYPDGVWLAELAALADPALVPGAAALALGLREEPGRPALETLRAHCAGRQLLLVLDNCEHLLAACTALAGALLRAAPAVRILATSREPLRVTGEQSYRVSSLSVPDPRRPPAGELAGAYEAVRLFVQRAQEQRHDFALTPANARAVAEVCARLDGIPLAIELAAARVGSMGVEAIAARLDDRFRLLTGGARDALPRQRTLRATLDWSYDLLSGPERTMLQRLSVFAGGWSVEVAEAVCADGDTLITEARRHGDDTESAESTEADAAPDRPAGGHSRPQSPSLPSDHSRRPDPNEVLDLLGGLVGKSLVQAQGADGEVRYALLETVRRYAWERLAAAGATEQLRDRHLRWCLALAEGAEPGLRGPEQERWLDRLEAEHDNLRAALGWVRERGAAELGLRLAGALWRFWSMRGYYGEGRSWLEGALASGQGTPAARARALNAAGDLAAEQGDLGRELVLQGEALALWRGLGDRAGIAASLDRLAWAATLQGDYGRAVALREECLALQRELGDRWEIAHSLQHLGWVAGQQGDLSRAVALQEEALALWRALGDRAGVARLIGGLGWAVARQDDFGRATALLGEALALSRELGDRAAIAASLNRLGWVASLQGEHDLALGLLEECLALQRELGDRRGVARSLGHLGWVAGRRGDQRRALALLQESLRLSRDTGARDLLAEGLESLAQVDVARGQPGRAAHLGGAAEAGREKLGMPLPPALRAGHDQLTQSMRAALGEEGFAAAWAEGRAMSLTEAIALALTAEPTG